MYDAATIRGHDLCTKCGTEPRARDSSYCLNCWRIYFRSYRRESQQSAENKHLIRGSEMMRRALLKLFLQIGPNEMSGYTAAEIVRDAKLDA